MSKNLFRLDILRILELPSDVSDDFEPEIDSLKALELSACLENDFGIVVEPVRITEIKTIGEIMDFHDMV